MERLNAKQLAKDTAKDAASDLLVNFLMGLYWVLIVGVPAAVGFFAADVMGLVVGASVGFILGLILFITFVARSISELGRK